MSAVLVLLLVVLPLLELYVLIQVGQVIGGWQTVGLLLLVSVLGSALIKREGLRAWRRLQLALSEGRLPGREVADGALVLLGGALLITPGFVSDVVGLVFLLPVTRPLARGALLGVLARRALGGPVAGGLWAATSARNRRRQAPERVVEGEVVDPR